jgi:hypothetical protein
MKNVIIYNIIENFNRYSKDLLINYLKAQIDNSLRFNWKIEDIILGTNFIFEYKGIKSVILENICSYNIYINKWYGMLELMEKNYISENFWFHDQDNWQINYFDFPDFDKNIAACSYVEKDIINTASIFVKKTAKDDLQHIKQTMDNNKNENFISDGKLITDETYLKFLNLHEYIDIINTEYNVGFTSIKTRLDAANKPVKVIGVKPNVTLHINAFLHHNLIDDELKNIFKLHKLFK